MKTGLKNSIQIKMGIILLIITVLLLGVYGVVQFMLNKTNELNKLNEFSKMTAERLSKQLAAPLWSFDEMQVQSLLKTEMAEKNVYALIVKGQGTVIAGVVRGENMKPVLTSEDTFTGDYIVKEHEIKNEDEAVGVLFVYVTPEFVNKDLQNTLYQTLFASIIVSVVIFITLSLLIRSLILIPIFKIAEFAGKLKVGDLTYKLSEGDDEIGSVNSALNSVVEAMKINAGTAKQIAEGNLQQTVKIVSEKDELGKSLSEMITGLNDIVKELRAAAEQVDSGAGQVLKSSVALSGSASNQAASIQETVSAMTEIGSQTTANAENATNLYQLADSAKEYSASGVKKMNEMVESMDSISSSSVEISKIIKTIDEIAFQTNLLALNAAVEAARAGKHGKGFAVVAQEVRNLAARSAKAVYNTTELIENSVKRVDAGSRVANETADALIQMKDAVSKVVDLGSEIALACNEQAQSISQVNKGLIHIDNATRENASHAEETSAASEQLSTQALQVRQLLSNFKVIETEETKNYKPDLIYNFDSKKNDIEYEVTVKTDEDIETTEEFDDFPAITVQPEIVDKDKVENVPDFDIDEPLEENKEEPELSPPFKKQASDKTPEKLKPEDIIVLDDTEFGKY